MKPETNIIKSSRHSKIIGNFGESILCNWLSRSGYEVAIIDHTGIDIIAYSKREKKRLGITVKSRTRCRGKECESVNLLKNKDYIKVKEACGAFGCEPWIGIYVETENYGDIYLMSMSYYNDKYRRKGRILDDWKMTEKYKRQYASDEQIKHIHIDFEFNNWSWK